MESVHDGKRFRKPAPSGDHPDADYDLQNRLLTSLDADFYRSLLDSLDIGIYLVDNERRIIYWNKGAEKITGYRAHEVVGKRCSDNILNHVDGRGTPLCAGGCPLAEAIDSGKKRSTEIYLHHKNGHRIPVSVSVFPLLDRKGKVLGAVEVFTDNSPRIAAIERIGELERMAYIDHLTGVANRRFAEISLSERLDEMKRYGWPFGIMMLDLDNFKEINDGLGHETGDAVLKMAAKTLSTSVRTFDIVGRWGGDEFIVIAPNVSKQKLQQMATRLRSLIAQSRLHVDGRSVEVTASFGATLARPGDTTRSIVRRADELLYASKKNGRNKVTTD